MLILLCYTSAFSEVIYTDFYAKILNWNFRLFDENSQLLVVVFISKLNFSFSFHSVDENCRIFVVVVDFVTKIKLFSSTKIFVFVAVDEKNTETDTSWAVVKDAVQFSRGKLLHAGVIIIIIIIIIIINDNVYGAVLMTTVTARVHRVHLMTVDWAPGGRQPSDQATRLGLWVRR